MKLDAVLIKEGKVEVITLNLKAEVALEFES